MRIFYLELKRIMKSKLTWILLALALLLSIVSAWMPTTYCYSNYTDEFGNEGNLTGLASIAYEKERQADASGIVTRDGCGRLWRPIRPVCPPTASRSLMTCRRASMTGRSSPSPRCSMA